MVTIGICDDEKDMRNKLAESVTMQMDLMGEPRRIMEFSSGAGLLLQFKENPYCVDILFLDIELGVENGMEIARKIRKVNRECLIIFVTGYAEYVFQGYEVGALNYILKPYKEQKIKDILEEAFLRLNREKGDFITVPEGSSLCRIPVRDILYFTSRLRKIAAVTADKEWEYYGKLADMEKLLPVSFVRIHQRYLVNMRYVERLDKDSVLLLGQRLPVSRQRYQETAGAFARLLIDG